MDTPSQQLEIVLIDDNFSVRYVLRGFLQRLAKRNNLDLKIHTSGDGVQGLGYIFTAKPDIIILDSTLPQYSGREIVEFLITNPSYRTPEHQIIVLHDGNVPLNLPPEYTIVDKRSNHALRDILWQVSKIISLKNRTFSVSRSQRFVRLGEFVLTAANRSDKIMRKLQEHRFGTLARLIVWLVLQILISLGLFVLRIVVPQSPDSNLQQYQADMITFRVRYYPTLVSIFLTLILIFVQVFGYILGGIAIFHLSDKIQPVNAAFGNGYTYRRSITIDHNQVSGNSDLSNFPVLVSGTYSYLATVSNGGKVQNSNGYDIIFTSDSTGNTTLSYEVERYVASTGEVIFWVKVPTVTYLSDTVIYMFYGNSSISTSQANGTGTWDSNFLYAYHLNEAYTNGTSGAVKDSTTTPKNGTAQNFNGTSTSGTNLAAKIGSGIMLDGTDDRIDILNPGTGKDIRVGAANTSYTIEAWYKFDGVTSGNRWFVTDGQTFWGNGNIAYALLVSGGKGNFRVVNNSATTASVLTASNLTTTDWVYLVGVRDANDDTVKLYLNGQLASSLPDGTTALDVSNNETVKLGTRPSNSEPGGGGLDEVRLSNTNRSAGWIGTSYNSANSPATFYTLGSEQTASDAVVGTAGTQTSYIGVSTTNQYVGGMFIVQPSSGTVTVTGITIAEQGTVNAQTGLANIKLRYELDTTAPYDCASESYAGSETQFGSTAASFNAANGTAAFTGSVAVTTTQAMCIYTVLDVTGSASRGETLEVEITNPSTDVTLSASKVASPATAVAIPGTTNIGSAPSFTVGTSGTQTSSLNVGTSQNIGGLFSITNSGNSANITGITIAEQGTVDATSGISNIKLYYDLDTSAPYDCASESYAGSESQFGSTGSFNSANGTVAFTGSVSVTLTQAMCIYTILDVNSSATNNQTIEIQITDPSTQVTVSTGTVSPNTAVAISGTTTIHNPSTSLTLRVNAAADSAYDVAGNSALNTGTPMELGGKDASGNLITGGVRFTNVTIPRGATITSAKLDFVESFGGNYGTNVKTKIYGEAADSPTTFSTSSLPRSRSLTTANVSWNSNGTIVGTGSLYSTSATAPPPEMATIVQEIVDRSGWASGNNMAFLVKDNGSTNDWWWEPRSYAFGASSAPYLYVTYSVTTVTASASGTQTSSVNTNSTSQYLGGKFVLQPADAKATITGITIAEQGTINAQTNMSNVKLYYELDTTAPYDCASESYAGTETQYGSAGSFNAANGTASFTGSVAVTTSQAMCVYVVADIGAASAGDTIEIQITDPSTQVTMLSGTVTPASAVAISGTTTVTAPNSAPTVTNVSVNGGSNITLTENTTTSISVTATVTDTNGYADISSVAGRLYRSGVSGAQACTLDGNNCYQQTGYSLTGCSGNSCTATLTFLVQFFAQPTDTGSPNAAEYWLGWVQATDASAATGTAFSPNSVTELNTLRALDVQTTVSYGSLLPGNNTGATNSTTTITNTGNSVIDIEVSGSQLCTDYPTCAGGGIPIGNQQYKTTTFTYGAGTALTSTPTWVNITIAKPTATPSNSTANLYWGLGLPNPLPAGSYTGSITVSAVTDQ
jgi:CheY-like chemotaxis protein